MKNQLLHTPDGVRDIYNGECEKKLYLQDKLHKVLLSYGFHDTSRPSARSRPISRRSPAAAS